MLVRDAERNEPTKKKKEEEKKRKKKRNKNILKNDEKHHPKLEAIHHDAGGPSLHLILETRGLNNIIGQMLLSHRS